MLKKPNCGIGFKIGTEILKHYQVHAGYNLGLRKVLKNSLSKDNKQQTYFIGISYMF